MKRIAFNFSAGLFPFFLCITMCHGTVKSAKTPETGPAPTASVGLAQFGMPNGFFDAGYDTKCADSIIGYRFVVWIDPKTVAVGFSTGPNCRTIKEKPVDGALRILVFDVDGHLSARKDMPYFADGNGEIVADGEAGQGPAGTLLVRVESVNLDKEGRTESPSEVVLFDSKLHETARLKRFLQGRTLATHALVFSSGGFQTAQSTEVLGGANLHTIYSPTIDWPTGTMDRKIGEEGYAFMLCELELRHGEFVATNGVYAGARIRCELNVKGKGDSGWSAKLKEGETAEILGILSDGRVATIVHESGGRTNTLRLWRDTGKVETLPWIPAGYEGRVEGSTLDFSRYLIFSTNDNNPCDVMTRAFRQPCDEGGNGRMMILDRTAASPVVDRSLPKNSRASIAPDGLHYASFESGELRIYPLPAK